MKKTRRWHSWDAQQLRLTVNELDPIVAITKVAAGVINEAGFERPPFTPDILASFQGIRDIRRCAMPGAARLVPTGRGLTVEVNEEHCASKQNFSINHETTHTLLPSYAGQPVDDATTGHFPEASEVELLCDVGAAALLLDARWLRPLARDAGPSLHTLFFLAEMFGASLQATARALTVLDLWPCAVVLWEEGYRKSERVPEQQLFLPECQGYGRPAPKLRVACPYVSASFGHYIPENKSVGPSSLVHACLQNGDITWGKESFDFGSTQATLYCENINAPYKSGRTVRQRVISFLLPERRLPPPVAPLQYRLEVF